MSLLLPTSLSPLIFGNRLRSLQGRIKVNGSVVVITGAWGLGGKNTVCILCFWGVFFLFSFLNEKKVVAVYSDMSSTQCHNLATIICGALWHGAGHLWLDLSKIELEMSSAVSEVLASRANEKTKSLAGTASLRYDVT